MVAVVGVVVVVVMSVACDAVIVWPAVGLVCFRVRATRRDPRPAASGQAGAEERAPPEKPLCYPPSGRRGRRVPPVRSHTREDHTI